MIRSSEGFDPTNVGDVLEHLPNICFYMKDVVGRWTHCNPFTTQILGAKTPDDILGQTDKAFWPTHIARTIMADDASVIRLGHTLHNKAEVIVGAAAQTMWVETTKVPARDSKGRICGLIGVTRVIDTIEPPLDHRIARAVTHIELNLENRLAIGDLAQIAGLSASRFRKVFAESMAITPHDYVAQARIKRAASILRRTDTAISQVAFMCGYCDQSHLTRKFTLAMGESPGSYRANRR